MIDFVQYKNKIVIEIGGGKTPHAVLAVGQSYASYDRLTGYDLEHFIIPYHDAVVDLVYASHVFEHLHDLKSMMRECWRVLKPDGKLYIVVPRKDSEKAYAADHVRYFTEFTFKSLERPEYVEYGWGAWEIEEMVTNSRLDIHVSLKPKK